MATFSLSSSLHKIEVFLLEAQFNFIRQASSFIANQHCTIIYVHMTNDKCCELPIVKNSLFYKSHKWWT